MLQAHSQEAELWAAYALTLFLIHQARRKSELEAAIARLRAEIQELDQNLEMMAQETETQGDPRDWAGGQQSGGEGLY